MPKMTCVADARIFVGRIAQLLRDVAPKRQGPGAIGSCPIRALVEAARRQPGSAAALKLQGYDLERPDRTTALKQLLERWRLGEMDVPKAVYLLDALALLFVDTTDAKGRPVLILRPGVARLVAQIVEENRHKVGRKPTKNNPERGEVQTKSSRKSAA